MATKGDIYVIGYRRASMTGKTVWRGKSLDFAAICKLRSTLFFGGYFWADVVLFEPGSEVGKSLAEIWVLSEGLSVFPACDAGEASPRKIESEG